MSGVRHLFNRFRHEEDHRVRDQAVLDLMEVLMLADHRSGQAERELIEHFVDTRSWSAPDNPETYQQQSTARVRAAMLDPSAQDALLRSIVDRLPTPEDRVFALDLLAEMATAEGGINTLEADLVNDLKARFVQ